MRATLHPCGDTAILVEVDDLPAVLGLRSAIEAAVQGPDDEVADRLEGVLDLVPAARTLLVVARSATELPAVRAAVAAVAGGLEAGRLPPASAGHAEVPIPVRYDGVDLDDVAALTGLSRQQVVAAHTGRPWTVGFCGFAPGFAYLVGGDPRLEVPRRSEPRTSVPAGAVALAGLYSGVYPRSSPGGWQVIGHTAAPLWDVGRQPPALLRPGARVRFVDLGGEA